MGIYFNFTTIDELLGIDCDFHRQQKEFDLEDLEQYDGKNGKPAYVSIEGIVYDISNESIFGEIKNKESLAGKDLTELFSLSLKINTIINIAPVVGLIGDGSYAERKILTRDKKHKHEKKGSCKYQEFYIEEALSTLEKIISKSINEVLEWQENLIKCPGAAAQLGIVNIGEAGKNGIGSSTGGYGLAGGASGGAGGGLGVAIVNVEKGGYVGTNQDTGKMIAPGSAGGATGGAVGSLGGTTSTPNTTAPIGNTGGILRKEEKDVYCKELDEED
ncbi:cytochrome b5 domain-containing protein [Clostridium saccharoperbutylacetonicum]|uniref:cytochrome b5 domain-containing protein n=1 Tax=Clostridium saccharoperbutylacetonicum TaxID=36745 RepID=UPI000983BAA8|nr:cytochrome b5 domain-containing protein [Clostridium saccharoperbutylacetonicum]AQR95299.1 cytochrome b5-like heme/steroid binding domain protein [Clostridium saccharoperbutylacetonicum]NSB31154.1 putative heme/steroid binding protein [Clostridium saccharoperbutylacetonicum]